MGPSPDARHTEPFEPRIFHVRSPFELSSLRSIKRLAAALALAAAPAFALQPLSEFLKGARQANVDQAVAARTLEQQEAESMVSLGRTLPSFSARGTYTRNQFESKIDAS